MTELSSSSPSIIKVAVLIAMPSPPSHGSSTTPLSASISSKSQPQPTTLHPLELPSSVPTPPTTLRFADDEELEQPLPHLEMGVTDVQLVIGRSGGVVKTCQL